MSNLFRRLSSLQNVGRHPISILITDHHLFSVMNIVHHPLNLMRRFCLLQTTIRMTIYHFRSPK
jgi:hypothetical protein